MGALVDSYKKVFVQRFNKDKAIPYYSFKDFDGLSMKKSTFLSGENELAYFEYSYPNFNKEKVVVFCHGIGPGHTAYLAEIEAICKMGYRVITLDYTGCGESGGEDSVSINQPTVDVINLLEYLKLNEKIVLIGHSLGAYTSLNVINKLDYVKNAVIISGFVDLKALMKTYIKLSFLINGIIKFEESIYPEIANLDNWNYLKKTNDNLLIFQSDDDPRVSYKLNLEKVIKFHNPSIKTIVYHEKLHNPTYTKEAVNLMNEWIDNYYSLVKQGTLKTLEERMDYFKDKPVSKMTEQDKNVLKEIEDFLLNC